MTETTSGKRLQLWLGIAVSLICLAAIFLIIEPAEIFVALRDADYGLWALAALSLLGFLLLRAIRWRFMLNSGMPNHEVVGYSPVFHIQNIGYLITNLLPFRLGDVARAVLIGNVPPVTIARGLSTMVVERVLDLLFVVILFPFSIAALNQLPSEVETAVRFAGSLAILAAIILIIAANQRPLATRIAGRVLERISFLDKSAWLARIDDLLLGLHALTRPKDGIILIFWSIVLWIPIIIGYYLGMRAVHLDPTWAEAAFVVSIAAFSVTAPSSPGQLGVFEASVTFALAGILGMPDAESASFAIIYHAANYLVIGILGALGFSQTSATFSSIITSTRGWIGSRNH